MKVNLVLAETQQPALMDLRMPISNGYEAAAKIRAHEKTKNIPIIALSASINTYNKNNDFGLYFDDGIINSNSGSEVLIFLNGADYKSGGLPDDISHANCKVKKLVTRHLHFQREMESFIDPLVFLHQH